jgi:hypothetical protein
MNATQVPKCADVSLEFLARICAFYNSQDNRPDNRHLIWQGLFESHYTGLHSCLVRNDLAGLASRLDQIHRNQNCFGLDMWIEADPNSLENLWLSHLTFLANDLGILPVRNPEDGWPVGEVPTEELLDGVETALGFKFNAFGNGATYGPIIKGRCVPFKLLQSACLWSQVRRYGPKSVLEIGAGLGRFGHLLGLLFGASGKKISYHTIDLPILAVQHAFLLGANFGPKSIWMAGELENPSAQFLIHGLDWLTIPSVDAVINQDSFPEIPRPIAESYIRQIASALSLRCCFFSVNHESNRGGQTRVFELVETEAALKPVARSPWRARNGYVLEVWRKSFPIC